MSNTATCPAFNPVAVADLLWRLSLADVSVRTTRRIAGRDLDDPGMRDFTATLSLHVSFADLDEDELPDWYHQPYWHAVAPKAKYELLAMVSPMLAELANDMEPEDEGAIVELVTAHGSILNPYRLRGSLFDALDSRSQEHLDLLPALTTNSFYGGIGLKPSLDALVEGVGNIVLLTSVTSSPRWEEVAAGLESALLSQILQDLAAGACAIITPVGKLPAKTAHKKYAERYWSGASFAKWRHGIWYATPTFRTFEEPAAAAEQLIG